MFDDMKVFLAHALQLEHEAAEGYAELARAMDSLLETEVAVLFRKLEGYSRMHHNEIVAHAQKELGEVPDLPGRDFKWPDGMSPENPLAVYGGGALTARQALELAQEVELRACDFYAVVAGQSADAEIQELAQDFTEEEAGHAEHLERWLQQYR